MPVRRRFLSDAPRRAAANRHDVHKGAMLLLRVVADHQLCAVRRNTVVVVAARRESRVDGLRSPARHRNPRDPPVSVEQQRLAMGPPVGRLEPPRRNVNRAPLRGCHRDNFQRAVERVRGSGNGCRLRRLQIDIREHRFLDDVFIVAAHADPHVKRLLQCDPQGSACQMKFAVFLREPQGEVRAALFYPQPRRRGNVGLDFVRDRALLLAILQRSQTAAMQRRVRVRRIGIQALADHEHRFSVFVRALPEKGDVRRQRDVAGHFLPRELESVASKPHVLAAAGDRVASFRRVVFHGTRVKNRSNVSAALEDAGPCWGLFRLRAVLRRAYQSKNASQRRQPNYFLSIHGEILHSPKRIGNVRLALEDCQFGLPLALGRILWRCSISAFAFISLFFPHMLSSPSQGEFFMSVNKVILVGRLGRDPETRYTGGGQAVANFSMATDESYKDKNGERQKRTEWHKIVVWSKLAEIAQQYLKKGSLIFVEGRIQSREWQDKEGQKRTSFEIVASNFRMLGSRAEGAAAGGGGGAAVRSGGDDMESHAAPADDSYGGGGGGHAPSGPEISDEDIPF